MRFLGLLLLSLLTAGIGSAQPVVMARTGTIDAAEGEVSLNGQPVAVRFGSSVTVAPGGNLAARAARKSYLVPEHG